MKKVTKIFGMMCMASVLAIGASSCNKDNTKTVSSFNFSLPAIEGENPFEDDSKAYIDMVDGVMKWYDGDEMMIYTIDEDITNSRAAVYTSKTGITGSTQAQFAGPHLAEGSEGFFAFYPASKASTTITEGNRVSFNVGGTQNHVTDLFANTARAGRIFMDPQGFVGASTCDLIGHTVSASLKHIFGYINVRIKDTDVTGRRLKSVTITDNQMHLTGSMSVCLPAVKSADLDAMKQLGENFKSNGNVATYMAGLESKLQEIGYMSEPDATSSVTLNVDAANEGMGATIDGSYRFFLMPLRPGALIGNFTVTLKFMEGDDVIINVPANKKYISIPGYYTNVSIDLKNGGTIL